MRPFPSAALLSLALGAGLAGWSATRSNAAAPAVVQDTVTVYGPRQLATPTGSATYHLERFGLTLAPGQRYMLKVQNGAADGSHRVSGGSVTLNGSVILSSTDVAGGGPGWSRVVQALSEDTLQVTVQGSAGAYLTVSLEASADPSFVVFGFERFIRNTGTPVTETRTFTVLATAAAPYRLCIINGNLDGSQRISSAEIFINGTEVLTQNELNQQVGSLVKDVALHTGENTLQLTLTAQPSGFLDLCLTATDVTPPVLTIAAPPPGFITRETQLVVSGTVQDETATEVTVNGQVAQRSGSAYSATVPLSAEGDNLITVTAIDAAGLRTDSTRTVIRDTEAPILIVTAPVDGLYTKGDSVTVAGTVTDRTAVTVNANGVPLPVDAGGAFSGKLPLVNGQNFITVTATDAAQNSASVPRHVIRDVDPPVLTVTAPANSFITNQTSITVSGTVTDASPVMVDANGVPLPVDGAGVFTGQVPLNEGPNIITVTATDAATNVVATGRTGTRDTQAPVIAITEPADGATTTAASVTVRGTVTDATLVTLTVNGLATPVGTDGAFMADVAVTLGPNTITVVATDAATNSASASRSVVRILGGPPDPATVASVVNRAEVTTIGDATTFLYSGENPIQTGVAPGTISPIRAAIVRGRVLDRAFQPLAGAAVTILAHPELGQTQSRADGGYDLAVNGGGQLTLSFAKTGYFPAQRGVDVPWQDYTTLDDVILLQPDAAVTVVDLASAAPPVARATVVSDADGPRQATVIFKPGNTATLTPPGGTPQPITTLTVRATEFTVGDSGPLAMPAELPPASQYTYAVQISADEQLAAGPGATVTLAQPVPFYVENFLEVPVGTKVPVGSYSAATGTWTPEPSGIALRVVGTDANGRALIDITGDGQADPPSALAALGIDDYELVQLAGTYPAGSDLWRALAPRFEPLDLNFPFVFVGTTPTEGKVKAGCSSREGDPLRCQLQAQTAFQSVGIVGSPFTLNYASDRTQGNAADRKLEITLTGPTLQPQLLRVELEVDVAGKRFRGSFAPQPNLTHTFTWDGKDIYGRLVQGTQPATVLIGYVFPVQYAAPANAIDAFGLPCAPSGTGTVCPFIAAGVTPARAERTLVQRIETSIGTLDATALGLGGFTLDVQNVYDPVGQVVYNGDGTRRAAAALPPGINTVAGNPSSSISGIVHGVPARNVNIFGIQPIAAGPDGSVYFADRFQTIIQRLTPDGLLNTILGRTPNTPNCSGDDGPAAQASANFITGLAIGPDGSVYFAESGNCQRVRKIGPDGIVRAFAGSGTAGFAGDSGPAVNARFSGPAGLAVGPDGSVYIADPGNSRIRRVAPDGIITTVAGDGNRCGPAISIGTDAAFNALCGNGIAATQARLLFPQDVEMGPDRAFYITDVGRVRRIGPDGVIRTYAGSALTESVGDGGPATQAGLVNPWALAIGLDGSVYVSQETSGGQPPNSTRIRRIAPNGIITTFAGNGTSGFSGDGGPAPAAKISFGVRGMASGPDGNLYLVDLGNNRVRKVAGFLPGFGAGQTVIASRDGTQLYVFSAAGRILMTLDALTRDTLFRFSYDDHRRLVAVADRLGLSTQIERDSTGQATAFAARNGERTGFNFDAFGNLTTVTDPAGGELSIAYGEGSLLNGITDFEDVPASATYDSLGRLGSATSPTGGAYTRTLVTTDSTQAQTLSSPLGRTSTTVFTTSQTGSQKQSVILPSGRVVETTVTPDGKTVTRYATGMVATVTEVPDPIVGMQSPLSNLDFAAPSGLTLSQRRARVVTFSDPLNPATLLTQTDSVIINGRIETTVFTRSTGLTTRTTPFGRRTFSTLDSVGRVVSESLPGLARITHTYDSQGRLIQATQGNRVVSYTHTGAGLVASLTDALGRSTRYVYDGAGLMTHLILASGDTVRFTYDANGLRTAVTPPGRSANTFTFTPSGDLASSSPPDVGSGSTTTHWLRNADGQVQQIIDPDSQVVAFSYDSAGRLRSSVGPNGAATFDYDTSSGNMKSSTSPQGIVLTYEWDGSLARGLLWSGPVSGTVRATQNNNFWVNQQTVNGQFPVSFGYDGDGLLTTAGDLTLTRNATNGLLTGTSIGQVTSTVSANSFAEPVTTEYLVASSSVLRLTYARDAAGRVTDVTEVQPGSSVVTHFTYDTAGRVATVSRDNVLQATYEYDSNGNRLRVVRSAGTTIGAYDAQDRLLTYGASAYSYNRAGRLVTKVIGTDTTRYTYTPSGDLLAVVLPGGTQVDYLLDAEGRRVGKRINGTMVQGFLYGGRSQLAAELDGSGIVVSRFVYGTAPHVPDYMVRGGNTFRLVTDYKGSVRLVVNVATGEIVQRLDYDEFGRIMTNTNPGFQPFSFAGGRVDTEAGLIHFPRREYDPETGRWTSRDSQGFRSRDWNLYAYVAGDPVNAIDPEGEFVFLGTEIMFRGLLRKIGEEILWNIAFDIVSGCASELLVGSGVGGCGDELKEAFMPTSWGSAVAGGAMLASYFPNRGQPGNAGQFRSGKMGRFSQGAMLWGQCVGGLVSDVANEAIFGEERNDTVEWLAVAGYGCGSSVVLQIVDFTLAARKYPSWKVKILGAFSAAILNTLFTAAMNRYDAWKAGEPWNDAKYSNDYASRQKENGHETGKGAR